MTDPLILRYSACLCIMLPLLGAILAHLWLIAPRREQLELERDIVMWVMWDLWVTLEDAPPSPEVV